MTITIETIKEFVAELNRHFDEVAELREENAVLRATADEQIGTSSIGFTRGHPQLDEYVRRLEKEVEDPRRRAIVNELRFGGLLSPGL